MELIHYWLFVDSRTRVVSRRLSQQAAEDFIAGLRNMNLDHWWAWNPFFRDWIPLQNIIDTKRPRIRMLVQLPESNLSQFDQDERTEASEQTQIPEEYSEVRNFLREETVDNFRDFHGDDLTISGVPKPPSLAFGIDRRGARRHEKHIEVLIAGKGKSFRTQTINVSLSGLMLEKPIPIEMQGGSFEIVFYFQSNKIKKQMVFQGKVSGDLKDRRRLVFGELSPNNHKLLTEILAA